MYLCYIDEAGCTGVLPAATSNVQPVLAIMGLVVHDSKIKSMTTDFLAAKQRYFPGSISPAAPLVERMRIEVKGSEVRKNARSSNRREKNQALGFLDHTLRILNDMIGKRTGALLFHPLGPVRLPLASVGLGTTP